jgi:hypothetical protein
MDSLTLGAIGAIIAAASAAGSSLLTIIYTKGVTARNLRRTTDHNIVMEDKAYEDNKAAIIFEQFKGALEQRIATLERELTDVRSEMRADRERHAQEVLAIRKEHMVCMVEHAKTQGKYEAVQTHLDRLWAHDKANKEQHDKLKADIEKIESHIDKA